MKKLCLKFLIILIITSPLNASEIAQDKLKSKEITICTPKSCQGKTIPLNENKNKIWHMFKNINSDFYLLINSL